MTVPLLQVRDLRRSFGGVPAVDGVSFLVTAGEVVALIGPNGSGKSTTANIIAGTVRADAGTLFVDGRELTNRPPWQIARHGLARTFQIARVWGRMTVAENLLVAGTDVGSETIASALFRRRSVRAEQRRLVTRVEQALDVLSLTRLADARAESRRTG